MLGTREGISITTTESGPIVSLSELTTLVGTFSSEPSMEFRISIAPEMPARKTQTLILCEQHVVPSPISLYKLWGHTVWSTFSIALIFILFQPAEMSYLASMTWFY